MDSLSIQLVLIIFFLVITVISLLHGLIQGFKKNMFFFILDVLFWGLFYLTVGKVTPLILENETIYGWLPLDGSFTNLYGYLSDLIAQNVQMDAAALQDEAIKGTINAVVGSIVSLVYLLLLAIAYLVVVKWLIYGIFFRKFFTVSDRKVERLQKKEKRYEKRNGVENRGLLRKIKSAERKLKRKGTDKALGMLSGTFRGLICCFLILCLVNSTIKLLPELSGSDNTTMSADDENTVTYDSIYDFILNKVGDNETVINAVNMIKDYQQSSLINMTEFKISVNGKEESVANLFADSITSGKYTGDGKDYSFAIREELTSLITIAEKAFYLTNGFDMDSVTWTNLNSTQVGYVQDILTILSEDQFVTNLASSLVTLGMSIEAVKEYLPDDVDESEYKNIDWSNELKTIAVLVADAYSLGDLAHLDYFDLDAESVKQLILDVSELESLNFLAHVGINYGIVTVNDQAENKIDLDNVKETLADLAVNGKFTEDIASFSDLYGKFIELYKDEAIDAYRDENGNITNYVAAVTSIDVRKFGGDGGLISTILEANFVTELLPDVMSLIREKIPSEYGSLLNPAICTSSQWEDELDAALTIIHDVTTDSEGTIHPFESIQKYDFSLLQNFSADTVVESDLLSYAIISLFIQTSKDEGLLTAASPYICVPDYLAVDEDENHQFAKEWYSKSDDAKQGELYVMLDQLSDIASNVKGVDNIAGSLSGMLAAVDGDELMSSDVLYYTMEKTVKKYNEYIYIPTSVTAVSDQKINGEYKENTITRTELKNLINTISDPSLIDIDLLTKSETDEEGNEKTSIEISYDRIMDLLKSKSLYDPDTGDTTNLNKLFESEILRTTMSHFISDYAEDYLVLIDGSYDTKTLVSDNSEIKVIKQAEFANLVKAIDDLDIDITSLTEDPLKMVDSFADEDKNLKPAVRTMFGYDTHTASYTYDTANGYSSILHATLSKYIIEMDSAAISIVVPDEVKYYSQRISGYEVNNLIYSLVNIGVDTFTTSEGSSDDVIDNIMPKLTSNDKLYDSVIIRATVTGYLSDSSTAGMTVPDAAVETYITSEKTVTKAELSALLKSVEDLKGDGSYSDAMKINDLTVGKIYAAKDDIADSYIIKATLTKNIKGQASNGIIVPALSYSSDGIDNVAISSDETKALITSLDVILGADASVNDISIDGVTIGKLVSSVSDINDSYIMRATVSKQIADQEANGIKMNYTSSANIIDSSIDDAAVLTQTELSSLFTGIGVLFNNDNKISDITFDDSIIYGKTKADYAKVVSSEIMVYSISDKVETSLTGSLKFLSSLYPKVEDTVKGTSLSYIAKDELTNALYGVGQLYGGSGNAMDSISNLDFDSDGALDAFSDDQIKDLCKSILISYNIREKLVENNNNQLNGILALNTSIAETTVTAANCETVLNNGDYSTYGEDSDIANLFIAFKTLTGSGKGYMNALKGNADSSSISVYKSEEFVTVISCDTILRDSIPNIIDKMGSMMDSDLKSTINPSTFHAKSRSEFADTEDSKNYYYDKGASSLGTSYTDGEFYKFIDFVDAGNTFFANKDTATEEECKGYLVRMLASDIAHTSTRSYVEATTGEIIALWAAIGYDYSSYAIAVADSDEEAAAKLAHMLKV